MKVALVSYEYPPDTGFGGIGTYTYQLSHMLASRGHHVEVFAGGSKLEGEFEEEGIVLHRVKVKPDEAFRQRIAQIFAERHKIIEFDIIETAEHNADAYYIVRQFPELPFVVKLHTPTYLLGRLFRGKVTILNKARFTLGRLLRGSLPTPYWRDKKELDSEYLMTVEADAILSPSTSLKDIVAYDWEIVREEILHLPNLFIPHQGLLSLSPGTLDKERVVITFIGKLERRKGIVELTRAAKRFLKQNPQTHLRLIGAYDHPSPHKARDMGEYMQYQLEDYTNRIEFTGAIANSQLPSLLADTDICIFPSLWENFPYVCLEAMSAARAVIGSNAGGMSEMIDDGVNGLLVPPQSPKAIVQAVRYLVEHPEERISFGLKARHKVLSAYNGAVIGKQVADIYQTVINRKNEKRA